MERLSTQPVPTEYVKAEADEASSRLQRLLYAEVLDPAAGSARGSDNSAGNRLDAIANGSDTMSNSSPATSGRQAAESARKNVQMLFMSNNFQGAELEQRTVVNATSNLDVSRLERQARALSSARSETTEPDAKSLLDAQQKNLVRQLASPFVERLVLAGLQLQQGKLGEAETTLTEALNAKISPLANDAEMAELRRSAELKRNELTLSRLTPTYIEERFTAIDRNGNNYLKLDELKAAKKSSLFSREEKGLLDFLVQNYDTLRKSSDDEYFRETSGISKKDVEAYRSKTRPYEFR